jgi:hypothetical protein
MDVTSYASDEHRRASCHPELARTSFTLTLEPTGVNVPGRGRAERMRRLRINPAIQTEISCAFSEEGRPGRRAFTAALPHDPLAAAAPLVSMFTGPEAGPAQAFEPENIQRILSLA